MSYIGTEPKDIRSFGRTKFDYTATQGQTAFTGADDDGKVLAFTVGQIEVYVNGILMDDSDFTTTGTGTVTLASAANLNDVVNVVSFETNIPDSNYVPASGGTFTGNITASGTLGVTGAVTASNGLTVDDDGATPLTVDRATDNGDIIDLQKDGTSVGNIAVDSNDNIMFGAKTGGGPGFYLTGSGGTTPFVLPMKENALSDNTVTLGDSSRRYKDIYLGGGAYIGGTGAANKLDDYEEGSFTPVLSWATPSNGSVSYQARTATYIRVGRAVTIHLEMRLNIVAQNSASLPLLVSGFPFNFHNTGGYGGSLMQVSLQGFVFTASHIPFGWGLYNSDKMYLYTMSSNALNNNLATPANYKTINVSGTYITP